MFDHCLYFNTTALARVVEREWAAAFKPFGLTPPQGFMLRLILGQPGLSQHALATELTISRPTATRLLDTQKGRLLDVQVRRAGVERLPGTDSATRYTVRGDLDLDLWYDMTDRLRRIAFDFKGSRFDYSEAGQRPSVAAR